MLNAPLNKINNNIFNSGLIVLLMGTSALEIFLLGTPVALRQV